MSFAFRLAGANGVCALSAFTGSLGLHPGISSWCFSAGGADPNSVPWIDGYGSCSRPAGPAGRLPLEELLSLVEVIGFAAGLAVEQAAAHRKEAGDEGFLHAAIGLSGFLVKPGRPGCRRSGKT